MTALKDITVSFIVPCYNGKIYLSKLLGELSKQTYNHRLIEVIIVDDGSPERVRSVFEDAEREFKEFARFSLITHKVNKGRAAARNSGIAASSGEILIFCDVDCYPSPQYVEKVVGLHEQQRRIAVRTNIRILPEIRQRSAYLRYRDSRYIGARSEAKRRRMNTGNLSPAYFATGGISVERQLISEAGLFDESFSCYGGEDEDMGFRLFKKGVRIIFGAEAVLWDADDRMTLGDACEKYKQYGSSSGDVLFRKHPEYCMFSPLRRLEPVCRKTESSSTAMANTLIRWALIPWASRQIRRFLNAIDGNGAGINPPGVLYKYVLICSYYEGVRQRKN